jgi:Domain of unknown function (DUF4468) with TBP-like fold
MMKNGILVVALISIAFLTGCAEFTLAKNANDPIVIVLKAPGKTQNQLHSATRSWFAGAHRNDSGEIINADPKGSFVAQVVTADMPCEGAVNCLKMKNAMLSYKLRIDAKDGEIKMIYTDFVKADAPAIVSGSSYRQGREHAIAFQSDLDAINYGTRLWGNELLAYVTKKQSVDTLPSVNE